MNTGKDKIYGRWFRVDGTAKLKKLYKYAGFRSAVSKDRIKQGYTY